MPTKNNAGFHRLSEEQTGRLIISAAGDSSPAAGSLECPELVEIADLIEGNLKKKEKQKLWTHLRGCDDCYQLFVFSLETFEELSEVPPEKDDKFYLISLGKKLTSFRSSFWTPLAAVAAALIVVTIYPRWSSRDLEVDMTLLLKSGNVQELGVFIKASDSGERSLGFSGETSAEQIAFNLGAILLEAEVYLRAGDYKKTLICMDGFIKRLRLIRPPESLVNKYQTITQNLDKNIPPDPGELFSPSLKNFLKENNRLFFAGFGRWLRAGQIAATLKNPEFYSVDIIDYLIARAIKHDLPKGVKRNLGKIKNIVQKKDFQEEDFKELGELFDKMSLLLGRE